MNSKRKILVVVDSIDIDDSSGSKANVALIQNLHAIGYTITVLHYTRKEIQLEHIACYSIPEKKWNLLYLLSRTQRLFTRYTKLNINHFIESLIGFSFTFFNDTNSIIKELKKENFKPDLVLTLSKGASFRPHYALLKLPELHFKWMAYVHDPYPFHYYPRPYNWVEPGFQKKERFFRDVSEKAVYSAFPSLLLKEWMGSYFPIFLTTGIVIPHQSIVVNPPKSILKYFDKTKFNILHAGSLMKQRSPKGLVEGFQLFLTNNPEAKNNARLLLLGNASYHQKMLDEYTKNIPELYIRNENIPFKEVYHLQKNVTINVILESKSEISPFLPGKFPHCVAADKPILLLGPYYGETKRLLGTHYPYVAEVDAVIEIAEIINDLYREWIDNPKNLKLNRKDLEDYSSVSYLKEVFIPLIK